ncbi:MAG: leucine-rich repeat domain-containing protein [Muribaculaceae bacterium]|nr:leucine-rich repeat domain-containing protein [Muribaculaceae bacterium]
MSETATIGQLRYDLNSSTAEATVTGAAEATSNIHNLSIPETVTHNNQTFTITAIGDMAFFLCDITGTLTLPKSLKIIKDRAFLQCEGLSGALNIPQSVHTIESYAFSECTGFNGTLTLPNSITSIGECAFYECSGFTGTLTLPQNITAIKSSTFYKCSGLTGPLTIPENVTIIEQSAFMYCSGFSSLTMYDNILTIQAYAFECCTGLTGQLKLPSKLTKIESRTFYDCSGLTGELIIPENVTSIGINAFHNCSGFYGNLRIPGNVHTIGTSAFWGCSGFTGDLHIPNNVRTIGESIEVSTTKIREGNSLTFSFATSDDSSWEYRWICNGIEISGNPTCEVTANMASGIEKDIEQLSIGLSITSYRPDGSVLNYAEYTSPEVDVYRRPTMPTRLLRKGDGTTRTVVTTLTHPDNELARLGYRFTYGYTDASGSDHAISTTNNRYCRIDDNIFNNPANRLWVYSQWTFDDGSIVTSGKRYIDGSADDNFNGSSFTPANRSGIAEIHYDHSEAIRYENRTIHIDTRTIGECLVNIHSASGICLKSIHLTQSDMIDMSSLPNGIYIISATTATDHIVQKIIIR